MLECLTRNRPERQRRRWTGTSEVLASRADSEDRLIGWPETWARAPGRLLTITASGGDLAARPADPTRGGRPGARTAPEHHRHGPASPAPDGGRRPGSGRARARAGEGTNSNWWATECAATPTIVEWRPGNPNY